MPLISALVRQRQDYPEFEVILNYIVSTKSLHYKGRFCFNKQTKKVWTHVSIYVQEWSENIIHNSQLLKSMFISCTMQTISIRKYLDKSYKQFDQMRANKRIYILSFIYIKAKTRQTHVYLWEGQKCLFAFCFETESRGWGFSSAP